MQKEKIRNLLIKTKNAIAQLKDGKEIVAYNKLLGIHQELEKLYSESLKEDSSETSKINSNDRMVKYGSE